ncbi:ATP-binding protein [Lutibacter sp. B2]|nr:ATP-binding protein [Lutibacter sp. B2]
MKITQFCILLTHPCICTSRQIKKYLLKISGPLLDRIDMHVEVFPIKYEELTSNDQAKGSDEIRKEVQMARMIQLKRYFNELILNNAQLNTILIKKHCKLGKVEKELMKGAFDKLSARAYKRIIKLSRTIAI